MGQPSESPLQLDERELEGAVETAVVVVQRERVARHRLPARADAVAVGGQQQRAAALEEGHAVAVEVWPGDVIGAATAML